MCKVLGVSQSGFHSWKDRPACQRQQQDMVLLAHVRSAFKLSNGTYGSPRMTRELQDDGHAVGRRRTARLMHENGLVARQKRRFKRTTDSEHSWPVAPNLLDQVFEAEAPEQKWGVDISYIWTREGWLYLSIVLDLFSRRVVGWTTSDRLHRALALSALRKALIVRQPAAGLIHHSDRGSQYCSLDYQAELRRKRHPDLNVGKGQLLRQRHGRDLLQDPQVRTRLAHCFQTRQEASRPSPATSTASTIPSGGIPPSAS